MTTPLSEPTANASPIGPHGPFAGPVLVIGLSTVVAMWVVWFLTHMPISLPLFPPTIAGPLLISLMLVSLALGISRVPAARGPLVGLAAGLLAAAINLLILGSKVVTPAVVDGKAQAAPQADGLTPSAPLILLGFLALGGVIGLIAGLIGSRLAAARQTQPASSHQWLARLAVVSCISILPLLALGGMVTSTGSGLAVPDWPGTYGANMFLYPIALMASDARVFLEHSHRLFGAMIGLVTLCLLIYTWTVAKGSDDRGKRWFAVLLFVLVVAQGLLGAKRVLDGSEAVTTSGQVWAVVHGVIAQVFFGLTVAFAARVSPSFYKLQPTIQSGLMRTVGPLLLGSILFQLLMGATYRHLHQKHALWTHAGFSLVVMVLAIIAASWCLKHKDAHRVLKSVGHGLMHGTGLQFILGWVAFWLVLTYGQAKIPVASELQQIEPLTTGQALQALVRTIHQANGAVVLALAVLATVWAWRVSRPKPRTT